MNALLNRYAKDNCLMIPDKAAGQDIDRIVRDADAAETIVNALIDGEQSGVSDRQIPDILAARKLLAPQG